MGLSQEYLQDSPAPPRPASTCPASGSWGVDTDTAASPVSHALQLVKCLCQQLSHVALPVVLGRMQRGDMICIAQVKSKNTTRLDDDVPSQMAGSEQGQTQDVGFLTCGSGGYGASCRPPALLKA